MQRRKFLLGAASTAIGASAVVGSGAFSAAVVEGREADINVSTDRNALIGLIPGSDYDGTVSSNRVRQNADGQLLIDFSDNAGGSGVNFNSTYQVGAVGFTDATFGGDGFPTDLDIESGDVIYGDTADSNEPTVNSDPAFTLVNQTDSTIDINLGYDQAQGSQPPENGAAALLAEPGSPDIANGSQPTNEQGEVQLAAPIDSGGEGLLSAEMTSGAALSFSLIVDVGAKASDESVSNVGWEGSLMIEAEEETTVEP